MTKDDFFKKLLVALGHSQFDLDVSAIKMLNSATWLPQAILSPVRFTNIKGAQKADQLKGEFNSMASYNPLLAFKFLLGQLLVACVLEADRLSTADFVAATKTFYQCINNCMPYTMKPHGTVSGFLIFLFFDSAAADAFVANAQQQCRFDFGIGVYTSVRPWAIDIPGRRLVPERKSWLHLISGFNPKKFGKDIFS